MRLSSLIWIFGLLELVQLVSFSSGHPSEGSSSSGNANPSSNGGHSHSHEKSGCTKSEPHRSDFFRNSWHKSWTHYPFGGNYSLNGEKVSNPKRTLLSEYSGHSYATRATCYAVLGKTSPAVAERTYEYDGGSLYRGKRFTPTGLYDNKLKESGPYSENDDDSSRNNLIVFYQITKYTYGNQKRNGEISAHIYDQITSGAFKADDYFTLVYGPYPDKEANGESTLRFKVMNMLSVCLELSNEHLSATSKTTGLLGIMKDDDDDLRAVIDSDYTSFTALKEFMKGMYVATHDNYYKCPAKARDSNSKDNASDKKSKRDDDSSPTGDDVDKNDKDKKEKDPEKDLCVLSQPNMNGTIDDISKVAEESRKKWRLKDYSESVPRYFNGVEFPTIERGARGYLKALFNGESEINKYVLMFADTASDMVRYTEYSSEKYAHRSCDRVVMCQARPQLYGELAKYEKDMIYMKRFPDAVENAIIKRIQFRRTGHELKETTISRFDKSSDNLIIDGKIKLGTPDYRLQGDLDPKLDRLYFSYYLMNLNPSYFTTVSVIQSIDPIESPKNSIRTKNWDYVTFGGSKPDSMFNCLGTAFVSELLYGSPMICGDKQHCENYSNAVNSQSPLMLRKDETSSVLKKYAEEQITKCLPFTTLNETRDFSIQLAELARAKVPETALESPASSKESFLSIEPRLGVSAVMIQSANDFSTDLASISTFPDEYALIYNAMYYYSYLPHYTVTNGQRELMCGLSRDKTFERSLKFLKSKSKYIENGFEILDDFFKAKCKDTCTAANGEPSSNPNNLPLCFIDGKHVNTTNPVTSGKYIWYSSPLCAMSHFKLYSYYKEYLNNQPQTTTAPCVFNGEIQYWGSLDRVVKASVVFDE